MADWLVTSSIAVKLIEHLNKKNIKAIWAPDKHLGRYINDKTNLYFQFYFQLLKIELKIKSKH